MSSIYRSEAGRQLLQRRYHDYLQSWPLPAEHRRIPTRHGETFVAAAGADDAPPVVLLHGAGTNSTIWFSDAAVWSQTRRVYLVDVIGEPGLSAEARPPLDSAAYAEWLDDVLDGLDVGCAAFVGASLGGWLAMDYAIRRPDRVERIALRAPGGIGKQLLGGVCVALLLMPFGDWGRRRAVQYILGDDDLGDFVDYMATIQQHYRPRRDKLPVFTDAQLQGLTKPLFVTVGAKDRMLDAQDTAQRVRRLIPGATVTVLPGTGHAITSDTVAILDFLHT